MAGEFGESTSFPPQSASYSGNTAANDPGDFECNICFELAQDPIVTLCGHLYCWPCLYRWLHHHSHSQECPVCKALVQEEKLVPLYGRGKTQTDPRSKSYPGINIPNRPAGQRPETAPPPGRNQLPNHGFGLMGGFVPMATARIGNFTLATAFGGLSLFPSLFNFQFHGFPDATVYGTTSGFPYGFNTFHGGHVHGFPQQTGRGQRADTVLKNLLLLIGFLVILALLCW
ncbi:E3 ubiquitin-protein ligase [Tripterygium wilfordii]|uniref:E3 ubiquitin-protein ligase RMA n=1 Tax=Tripterygium wilfordii TaxID=458696 RepID=A0A7J7CPT3_TRIWF|nr:E3 ubiquitin-protein ligase RNF185-like [Tripterygium wilfordii]KAF5736071.1 E3 ubiquitin-protein ligase [Tripterygium wilfordii]